jgi:hypothetical protein
MSLLVSLMLASMACAPDLTTAELRAAERSDTALSADPSNGDQEPVASAEPRSCNYSGPYQDTTCALLAAGEEDLDLRPDAHFFEPSKALFLPLRHPPQGGDVPGSQDALAIEVEFEEPIFPFQNRASVTDRHFGGFTFAFAFTPMYRVRIWKEFSAPVRVPSFMPRGTAAFEHVHHREPGWQWGQNEHGQGRFVKADTFLLTLGHHSNGQDGCLFVESDGTQFPSGECPTNPSVIRINRLNGSFSTNYFILTAFRSFYDVGRGKSLNRPQPGIWYDERYAVSSLFAGATYEYNFPIDLFGGALEKPIRPIYGMNRLRATVGYERFPAASSGRFRKFPRFRATAWFQWVFKHADSADCGVPGALGFDGRPCSPRAGYGSDLNVGLGSKIDYLGLYARYYHAQDYYNLSFTHLKQDAFQVGLSFTPGRSRPPTFPIIAANVLREEGAAHDRGQWKEYRVRIKRAVKRLTKSRPERHGHQHPS